MAAKQKPKRKDFKLPPKFADYLIHGCTVDVPQKELDAMRVQARDIITNLQRDVGPGYWVRGKVFKDGRVKVTYKGESEIF